MMYRGYEAAEILATEQNLEMLKARRDQLVSFMERHASTLNQTINQIEVAEKYLEMLRSETLLGQRPNHLFNHLEPRAVALS